MLAQVSVEEFIKDLASDSPAPGGGSTAAMAGALGASLLSMVCRLTIGKKDYEPVQSLMEQSLLKSDELHQRMLALMEEDVQAFSQVMASYKLSKTTDAEKKHRTEQIQQAYHLAADVPCRIALAALEILALAPLLEEKANKNVLSDVEVAVQMALAALKSAIINVKVNLPLIKDQAYVQKLNQDIEQWMAQA